MFCWKQQLLLAHLMGQYCFARWRLSASSVTRVGGRVAATAWRASTITFSQHLAPCIFFNCWSQWFEQWCQ